MPRWLDMEWGRGTWPDVEMRQCGVVATAATCKLPPRPTEGRCCRCTLALLLGGGGTGWWCSVSALPCIPGVPLVDNPWTRVLLFYFPPSPRCPQSLIVLSPASICTIQTASNTDMFISLWTFLWF